MLTDKGVKVLRSPFKVKTQMHGAARRRQSVLMRYLQPANFGVGIGIDIGVEKALLPLAQGF